MLSHKIFELHIRDLHEKTEISRIKKSYYFLCTYISHFCSYFKYIGTTTIKQTTWSIGNKVQVTGRLWTMNPLVTCR